MSARASAARSAACLLFAAATGCASVAVDPDAGFPDVAATLESRTDARVAWSRGQQDEEIAKSVEALLAGGLDADEAVQIALLNNRELQASYADLGVAQAEVVQASLLHNPVVGADAMFGSGAVDLLFSLALDVVDLFYAPARKRAATADFEETRLLAAGGVLDVAWAARTTFYEHQGDEQMLEMRRQIAASTAAALDVAQRMREAGNITELDLARERALAEQARLDLREAEIAARRSRERLNPILGLWGAQTAWTLASPHLPDPTPQRVELEASESRAIERSLELAAAERHLVAAGENVGLIRASRYFPELVAGGAAERDDGDWTAGPSASIPLPLFDRGQARLARGEMELLRARDLQHALGVHIRAAVRDARDRMAGEGERAAHYLRVLLPLRERIVQESVLHYNAMQLGVIELLRAKQEQIETGVGYVEALRAYWLARADLELLLAGRLPPPQQSLGPAPPLDALPRFPFPTLP